MFTVISGSITITSTNINALRELSEDIYNCIGDGNELPNYISDMLFEIDSMYRMYHDLPEDDYEYHPELK